MTDYIDEYGVNHGQGVEIDGVVWAPVNCGYKKATTSSKGYPYGKLYQWGRKYGQGYSTAYDESAAIVTSGPVSLDIGQAEENAKYYFKYTSNPYDWVTPQNGELWNSGTEVSPIKTEYDPCPKGWRVPTFAELQQLVVNHSSWTSYNGQNGYWFSGLNEYSATGTRVFFPAAGERRRVDAAVDQREKNGYYWSSKPGDSYYNHDSSYYIFFLSSTVDDHTYYRVYGYSVRCVQE
jgi:uncharacterized protein (TIGR02145 family)